MTSNQPQQAASRPLGGSKQAELPKSMMKRNFTLFFVGFCITNLVGYFLVSDKQEKDLERYKKHSEEIEKFRRQILER